MNFDELQENTKLLEEANKAANKLVAISKIVLMYNNGAPADSCMQRIKNIIMETDENT